MREISTSNKCKQKFSLLFLIFGLVSAGMFIPLMGFWHALIFGFTFCLAPQLVGLSLKARLIDRGQSDSTWWEYKHFAVRYFFMTVGAYAFISLATSGFDFGVMARFVFLAVVIGILYPLIYLVCCYLHYFKVRKKKPTYIELLLGSHQNMVLNLNCRFDDAFELCRARIKSRTKFRILQENEELGLVRLGGSHISIAKDSLITILISEECDNRSKITILSRPNMDIGALDYGGNIDIIRELTSALSTNEIELLANG